MYLNNVIISGNLTADPEVRVLSGEKPVSIANFTIANNEPKKDGKTTFIKVTAFGRTAEITGEYLGKGSPVVIVGELKQRSFESKEGQKVSYLYIKANSVQMFPKKGNGDSIQSEDDADRTEYVDENDIPF